MFVEHISFPAEDDLGQVVYSLSETMNRIDYFRTTGVYHPTAVGVALDRIEWLRAGMSPTELRALVGLGSAAGEGTSEMGWSDFFARYGVCNREMTVASRDQAWADRLVEIEHARAAREAEEDHGIIAVINVELIDTDDEEMDDVSVAEISLGSLMGAGSIDSDIIEVWTVPAADDSYDSDDDSYHPLSQ